MAVGIGCAVPECNSDDELMMRQPTYQLVQIMRLLLNESRLKIITLRLKKRQQIRYNK